MNEEAKKEFAFFVTASQLLDKETDAGINLNENLIAVENSIKILDGKIAVLKEKNLSTEMAEELKNHLFYLKYKILEKL